VSASQVAELNISGFCILPVGAYSTTFDSRPTADMAAILADPYWCLYAGEPLDGQYPRLKNSIPCHGWEALSTFASSWSAFWQLDGPQWPPLRFQTLHPPQSFG